MSLGTKISTSLSPGLYRSPNKISVSLRVLDSTLDSRKKKKLRLSLEERCRDVTKPLKSPSRLLPIPHSKPLLSIPSLTQSLLWRRIVPPGSLTSLTRSKEVISDPWRDGQKSVIVLWTYTVELLQKFVQRYPLIGTIQSKRVPGLYTETLSLSNSCNGF